MHFSLPCFSDVFAEMNYISLTHTFTQAHFVNVFLHTGSQNLDLYSPDCQNSHSDTCT